METNCISCSETLYPNALFCHNCGAQQKCISCQTPIIKNARHCIGCGIFLSKASETSYQIPVNTIKFNQTRDTRSYEVTFTDNVGAGVVEVIRNMSDNQSHLQLYNPKYKVPSNSEDKDSQIEEVITEDSHAKHEYDDSNKEDSQIPHIIDVENTLECSEQHWILIYAFYISKNGKIIFTKDNLLKIYKEKRGTESRVSNFSVKWKSLFKGLVKTIKTDEFKLTEKGIETVIGLISGKIKSNAAKTLQVKKGTDKKVDTEAQSNKKGGKTAAKTVQIEEFDLYKNAKKQSLSDFLKERKIGDSTTDRILAIAYYITNYCKAASFSEGNIEYAYKAIGLNKRPLHLYQTILNTKNKSLWYDKENTPGKWKLARPGEIHFEENFGIK